MGTGLKLSLGFNNRREQGLFFHLHTEGGSLQATMKLQLAGSKFVQPLQVAVRGPARLPGGQSILQIPGGLPLEIAVKSDHLR